TIFDAGACEALRALLHQSPRTFGKPTSRWTLALAAEVSFAQGLPPRLVSDKPIFNPRGTAVFRRQGDRSGLTRAQRPSEAQSNKLCDPSMGEQNLLSKAASFRGQWLTLRH